MGITLFIITVAPVMACPPVTVTVSYVPDSLQMHIVLCTLCIVVCVAEEAECLGKSSTTELHPRPTLCL